MISPVSQGAAAQAAVSSQAPAAASQAPAAQPVRTDSATFSQEALALLQADGGT